MLSSLNRMMNVINFTFCSAHKSSPLLILIFLIDPQSYHLIGNLLTLLVIHSHRNLLVLLPQDHECLTKRVALVHSHQVLSPSLFRLQKALHAVSRYAYGKAEKCALTHLLHLHLQTHQSLLSAERFLLKPDLLLMTQEHFLFVVQALLLQLHDAKGSRDFFLYLIPLL